MKESLRRQENSDLVQYSDWFKCYAEIFKELQAFRERIKNIADPSLAYGVEREFLDRMNQAVQNNLAWFITHNSELPSFDDHERAIIIANHPGNFAVWSFAYFLQEHFVQNLAGVSKLENYTNTVMKWLLGGPLKDSGKGIFIDRNDREAAKKTLRKEAPAILSPGTGLIIFPDQHRVSDKRLEQERKIWSKRCPDMNLSWMTETCFPRSGGLWSIIEANRDEGVQTRFLDVCVTEPVLFQGPGVLDFYVQERQFGELETKEELRESLVQSWIEKNERIRAQKVDSIELGFS